MNLFKKLFKSNSDWSEWKLVQKHVAGFTTVNGKEVVRYADIYERHNRVTDEYEIKKEFYKTNYIFDNL